jgi:hypothetical protein
MLEALLLRSALLGLLVLILTCMLWGGRRFVEAQRQRALAAPALAVAEERQSEVLSAAEPPDSRIRILLFSSDDCQQCHRLQKPALRRVQAVRGEQVAIVEIDAPSSPRLTERYHVLTLPTTVVLDAQGRAHAVNYGFAATDRLLAQIDAALQA